MFPYVEQTRLEQQHLLDEIQTWVNQWKKQDRVGQYTTQLEALEAFFSRTIELIRRQFETVRQETDTRKLYRLSQEFEERLLWLRRAWEFFKEKFDQRNAPGTKDILKAADEVVWSCFHPAMQCIFPRREDQPPAPLAFIESEFSPAAFPLEIVPPSLRSGLRNGDAEAALRQCINKLPIPLVRIPPACIRSPWLLIFLGHEVGHQVQYAVKPNLGFVSEFQAGLETLVSNHQPQTSLCWKKWSQEIFADAYSVACMGRLAGYALSELIYGPPEALIKRDGGMYPPTIVRLRLIQAFSDKLKLPNPQPNFPALNFDQVGTTPIQADLNLIPQVVDFLSDSLPGLNQSLQSLTGFNHQFFERNEPVDTYRRNLLQQTHLAPPKDILQARWLTCAGYAAWLNLVESFDPSRFDQDRKNMAEKLCQALQVCGPEGTRAAGDTPSKQIIEQSQAIGDEVGSILDRLLQGQSL